jgi:hypothetical protein
MALAEANAIMATQRYQFPQMNCYRHMSCSDGRRQEAIGEYYRKEAGSDARID